MNLFKVHIRMRPYDAEVKVVADVLADEPKEAEAAALKTSWINEQTPESMNGRVVKTEFVKEVAVPSVLRWRGYPLKYQY